jgi:ABC-2 type transport system ATP-binding protein
MTESPVLRVERLAKQYGSIRAVDGISFEVRAGEIYGLLGPNGAGKTTTLSMLAGLLKPDEGRVLYDGLDLAADPKKIKAEIGVVPQETALYEELSALENLRFWGGLYGLGGARLTRACRDVLEKVGLTQRAKDRVKDYSGGMKRRLNLALGLVHEPRVLLLDEPTVGIDPQARLNVLEVVRAVAAAGTAVLYTTHYLEEAESLCDRIGILDHGTLLAEGTLAELEKQVGEGEVVTVEGRFDPDDMAMRVGRIEGVRLLSAEPERLVIATEAVDSDHGWRRSRGVELLETLLVGDLQVGAVSIRPPSLNGLFLKLTGRELRD